MSDTIAEDVVEAPVDDIRSSIRAAFEEQQERAEAPERPARVSKEPVEPEPQPAKEAVEKPADGRARGPDGKFLPKDAEVAEPVEAKAPKQEVAEKKATEEVAPVKVPEGSTKEPPANWLHADKELFKGLPPNAQDFLLRRHASMEADYTRKTQQVAQLRQDYEPVAQIFAPYAEQMRQRGLTPATLVQAWAGVEKELVEGRGVDVIRKLVDGYRIPVAHIAQALGITPQAAPEGQQPAAQPQVPPTYLNPIVQELNAVKQHIAQEQQRREYEAQQARYAHANRVGNDIEQFRSAVDSAGQPLHPYFADVEADMAAFVEAARARGEAIPPLNELYDRAVWSNPSTRAALQQQQIAAAQAQQQAAVVAKQQEVRAKAERARRAGSSVTNAPGGSSPGTVSRSNGSIRDELRAAVEAYAE